MRGSGRRAQAPILDRKKPPRLSAQCKDNKHTNCYVLNCTCTCHQFENDTKSVAIGIRDGITE